MEDKIYFYLPGIADTFDVIFLILNRMAEHPDHFRDNICIGGIYGCPPSAAWNGGRYVPGYVTFADFEKAIQVYNHYGVPVRFTWTNPTLTAQDLEDEYCNQITAMAHNGLNEILVNNDMFEEFVRECYPHYPLISSTTKRITSICDLNEELSKDYKLVVLDYDFNNKWDLLQQIIHPERCEILVNPSCNPNCPRRKQHYKILGLLQKQELEPGCPEDEEFSECPAYRRHLCEIKKLPTFISWESIEQDYIPMGFRHFKIEGRTIHLPYVMETFLYYLVKEEYRDGEREILYTGLETYYQMPNIPIHYSEPNAS